MKKSLFFLFSVVAFVFLYSCAGESQTTDAENTDSLNNVASMAAQNLKIHGTGIWVRSTPVTGDVVMKLNEGDECKIIEKGIADTIKQNVDYWYKIEFNGQQGWVFGSQTTASQNVVIESNSIETIALVVYSALSAKDFAKLNSFIKADVGVYKLYNPGSMVAIDFAKEANAEFIDFEAENYENEPVVVKDLPAYDCGEMKWAKEGAFLGDVKNYTELSTGLNNMKEYNDVPYTPDQMKAAKKAEKMLQKVLLVTGSNIKLYFSQIENKWYLVAIDAVTPCEA